METAALRWCEDIGMFAVDRSRKSCVHRTAFCEKMCFNNKLYAAFGHAMNPKDVKNDAYWRDISGDALAKTLDRKRNQTDRVRLMTRGEAFSDESDVARVRDIAAANPARTWWIPTRAWRAGESLRAAVDDLRKNVKNVRILASIDPTTTREEWEELTAAGWSTMFFGDDDAHPFADDAVKCPKTWEHKVHCDVCDTGCFRTEQTHIWLKMH